MTLASARDQMLASIEKSATELRIDDLNAMRQEGYRAGLRWAVGVLEADPEFKLPEYVEALAKEADKTSCFPGSELARRLRQLRSAPVDDHGASQPPAKAGLGNAEGAVPP